MSKGRFGAHGGQYIPETLMNAVIELEEAYEHYRQDPEFNRDLEVLVLPNLYGDIVSDVAAEICGGVGTAGSANIGGRYALFESIHGTAMMLVNTGRAAYADPSSLLRAAEMLLAHIGRRTESELLGRALDICGFTERKLKVTSFPEDASTEAYTDYILETIARLRAEAK